MLIIVVYGVHSGPPSSEVRGHEAPQPHCAGLGLGPVMPLERLQAVPAPLRQDAHSDSQSPLL